MKEVPLWEVKDDLSRYLRQAAKEEIVITRHGKAAGVLIGFDSEDEWFDYRLENDPRFFDRIAAARPRDRRALPHQTRGVVGDRAVAVVRLAARCALAKFAGAIRRNSGARCR
jgi:prevent-host-death family protein